MLLGAGTVLDAETARASILAGAEFLVSPNLRPATIEMAKRYSKSVFPGALTPTEILGGVGSRRGCREGLPLRQPRRREIY